MSSQRLIRIFPGPAASLSVEEAYADLDLPPGKPGRPYTVINAVGTLDGRGAVAGKSTPIGSEVDHRLMRNIRAGVDAVLVGAGTLRSEDLTLSVDQSLAKRRRERGLNEQPIPIILAGREEIPAERKIFRTSGEGNVLIFTESHVGQQSFARLSVLATVLTTSETGFPEPESVVRRLAEEFGVRRLLVEGGPRVNHSFIKNGLVDEIFLTLAPKVAGGDARSLTEGASLPPEAASPNLVSVYLAGSELYLRYALRPLA